jgi:hypothetical protein
MAILTSFIATCKRLHIEPFAYLCEIVKRISANPTNWIKKLCRTARRLFALPPRPDQHTYSGLATWVYHVFVERLPSNHRQSWTASWPTPRSSR